MKIFLGSFFTGTKKVVRSLHSLARFESSVRQKATLLLFRLIETKHLGFLLFLPM